MMLATVQGVSHVFDTLAGVEAAQLQTVLVQAEEVLIITIFSILPLEIAVRINKLTYSK